MISQDGLTPIPICWIVVYLVIFTLAVYEWRDFKILY